MNCSICYDSNLMMRCEPCEHIFCSDCMEMWSQISNKCPY